MDEVCLSLRISGRVQKVGYRAWMVRTALSLGLDGWVRNDRNGDVEALVFGREEAVDRLVELARRGPMAARVDRVDVTVTPSEAASVRGAGFHQHRTQ